MKKLAFMMSFLTLTVCIISCSNNQQEDLTDTVNNEIFMTGRYLTFNSDALNKSIDLLSKSPLASKVDKNTTVVVQDDFATLVDGYSTTKRNASGVTINFKAYNASNLNPAGHAVTLWAVFFKQGDPIAPEYIYSMYHVNGHVIDEDGIVEFGGRVKEGVTKDLWYGMPLEDAENDVLLIVAKTHGPAIPSILSEQLHTLDGGCNGDGPDSTPPCYEYLFSLHL